MLTLSESIRLGSFLRPQAFGSLFKDGRSCALGAAMEAIGQIYQESRQDCPVIIEQWPWVNVVAPKCPICLWPMRAVPSGVTHLNDMHRWTREQIADWVQTIEPKAITEQSVPVASVSVGREG